MDLILLFQGTTGVETGTSAAGQQWSRTTAIFQTVDDRQTIIAPTCLGNMVEVAQSLTPGAVYRVKLNVESRLHEGKYFHDIRAWSIKAAFNAPSTPQISQPTPPTTDWDNVPDPL